MGTFDLIVGILLAILGAGIVLYVTYLLLRPFVGEFRGLRGRLKLKSKISTAQKADQELKTALSEKALTYMRESFYLDPATGSIDFSKQVLHHNLSALGRIVTAAEKYKCELKTISIAEELFQTRAQLVAALIERRVAGQNISKKHSGKAPGWAINEIQQQVEDINEKIDVNHRALVQALGELFDCLKLESSKKSDVVYH